MEQNFETNNSTQSSFVQPRVALSKDGQYLLHFLPGLIVRKHINFYKAILGVPYTPKAANSAVTTGRVS
jgi:hypothetical protein